MKLGKLDEKDWIGWIGFWLIVGGYKRWVKLAADKQKREFCYAGNVGSSGRAHNMTPKKIKYNTILLLERKKSFASTFLFSPVYLDQLPLIISKSVLYYLYVHIQDQETEGFILFYSKLCISFFFRIEGQTSTYIETKILSIFFLIMISIKVLLFVPNIKEFNISRFSLSIPQKCTLLLSVWSWNPREKAFIEFLDTCIQSSVIIL